MTVHYPASNGLIGGTDRKILQILFHLAGRLHEAWEHWFSHVPASINGSIISSTGKTSHYTLYGFEKRLPYDVLVQSPLPHYSLDDDFNCSFTASRPFTALFGRKASREEM